MSKQYLTGIQRLKVIKEYLDGKENPDWEVFPTRKEGKYIIKKRLIEMPTERNEAKSTNRVGEEDSTEETGCENINEQSDNDQPANPQPLLKESNVKMKQRGSIVQRSLEGRSNGSESAINFEILKQLKTLGEEMRAEREAKKQKKLIKQTVQSQMLRYPRYVGTPQMYMSEEAEEADDETEDVNENEPIECPKEEALRSQREPLSDGKREVCYTAVPEPAPKMFVRRRVNLLNR